MLEIILNPLLEIQVLQKFLVMNLTKNRHILTKNGAAVMGDSRHSS